MIDTYIEAWDESIARPQYDLVIASFGFESRATNFELQLAVESRAKIAFGFDYLVTERALENRQFFVERGYFINRWGEIDATIADSVYGARVKEAIDSCVLEFWQSGESDPIRVMVDISAMNKVRIALTILKLMESSQHVPVIVDFVYSPAVEYPEGWISTKIEHAGPILRQLAGWATQPELPVIAIFGLGMEYDRAIGMYEQISPAEAYSFSTASSDDTIQGQISSANELFYPVVSRDRQFTYDMRRPVDCFRQLASVLAGCMRRGRPVIITMGPKIFTALSVLLGFIYQPQLAVWRVSSGRHVKPGDLTAAGGVVGFRCTFEVSE